MSFVKYLIPYQLYEAVLSTYEGDKYMFAIRELEEHTGLYPTDDQVTDQLLMYWNTDTFGDISVLFQLVIRPE